MTGPEAAGLARTSRDLVRDFRMATGAARLHLFLATPLGLAILLGHHWNAIGAAAHCYEYSGQGPHYLPAWITDLT